MRRTNRVLILLPGRTIARLTQCRSLLFRWLLCGVCMLAGADAAHADIGPGPSLSTVSGSASLCRAAIAQAERTGRIPAQLLAAIGRVESGRRDPVTGAFAPWPWTVNAQGQGFYFDTRQEALAAVREMRARGVRSIDIGCMQVNLMHHPDAFASLEQAFDPAANAAYAAKFLAQLFDQTGSWPKAAALYHSATPEHGEPYQRKVLAAWPEERRLASNGAVPESIAGPTGFLPPRLADHARIIPLDTAGGAPPGRGLAAYRTAPVAMVGRIMRARGG